MIAKQREAEIHTEIVSNIETRRAWLVDRGEIRLAFGELPGINEFSGSQDK